MNKNIRSLILFTLIVILGHENTVSAAARVIKFTNKTGQNVDDLHLDFRTGATIDFTKTSPFNSERGNDKTSRHNLYGATIENGKSATVRITSNSTTIKLKKWWWTKGGNALKDGKRVGEFEYDDGSGELAFSGGSATGDGLISVVIDGTSNIFQTNFGDSSMQTASAFHSFLTGITGDLGFLLMFSQILGDAKTVSYAGNLLGDIESQLKNITIIKTDSGQDFTVTHSPVPVPAAVWLMGSALLGLMGVSRRNKLKS